MKLHTIVNFVSPEAKAEFERAAFLFEAANDATAKGFWDLADDLCGQARKRFNNSRALELQLKFAALSVENTLRHLR